MPRNGSGQYNPLTNTWNPPVTGVLATGADFQAQLNDISTAITQSVSKDGQTPMTASLPMGNNSIVGIASGTVTSPSISPINDTNTGLYFPAADTVAIATGGVKRVEVDANGNFLIGLTSGTNYGPLQVNAGAGRSFEVGGSGSTRLRLSSTDAGYSLGYRFSQNNGTEIASIEVGGTATSGNSVTDNFIRFNNLGSERARITSGGNLLVGSASNATGDPRLYVAGAFSMSGGNSIYWDGTLRRPTFTVAYDGGSSMDCLTIGSSANTSNTVGSYIRFLTGPSHAYSERARITNDGNLLVGTTTPIEKFTVNGYISANGQVQISGGASTIVTNCNGVNWYGIMVQNLNTTSSNAMIFINSSGATIGSIAVTNTNTAFNQTSDYRLKEDVKPMTGALAKVAALKPCTYTWKADGSAGEGFIAHELAEVVPAAVTGEKDGVNEDGSIKAQGIDTSFLVATLTAAIQELNAKFEEYKAAHP